MTRREALSLFAHILRLHRQKLPFEMRQLGDTYVKFVGFCVHYPRCSAHISLPFHSSPIPCN